MGYLVISRSIAHLQVSITVYGKDLNIICFRIDADDHYGVAPCTFQVVHVPAVNSQKQYVIISVHIHQGKIIIIRSRFVYLVI